MRLVGLAVAGVLTAAAPAVAQYVPRPVMPVGPRSAQDVSEIVQAMGLEPVGAPVAHGPFYVQRARDGFGRVLRVTVDARRSQVIAVQAAGQPRGPYASYAPYGAYAGYGPYRGPHAAPGPVDSLEPPGSAMGSRLSPQGAVPPHSASITPDLQAPGAVPAAPKTKSAAVTPQQPQATPTPRKRPSAAPQQAAGSINPPPGEAAAAPQAPPQAAPAAPTDPAKPQITLPPVAPLE
jgi:hypothetical protein